jgi:hypothetical protein
MQTPVSVAGKKGRCQDCNTVMVIPCLPPASGVWSDFDESRIYLIAGAELATMSDGLKAVRFSCLRCGKRLWLPNRQTHKKAECAGCALVMRLSTAASVGTTSADAIHQVDDSIRFKCPECQHAVHIESEFANKKGRCPECDAVIDIPGFSKMMRDSNPAALLIEPSGNDLFEAIDNEDPLLAGSWDSSGAPAQTKRRIPRSTAHRSTLDGSRGQSRPGLPWENEQHVGSRLWDTVRGVLISPADTYSEMKREGALGKPIGFSLAGMMLGGLALAIYYTIFMFIVMMRKESALADTNELIDHSAFMKIIANRVGMIMAATSLGQLLLIVVLAAIHQMALSLVQAARESLATTIAILCYAMGSIGFTLLTLPLAPLALVIGLPRALKQGSMEVHGATAGQANTALVIGASTIGAFVIVVMLMAKAVGG